MNCTIEQERVLNVWLNLCDEGAYAMCHQCHDSIYTGCHFIFQLNKVNNLRILNYYRIQNSYKRQNMCGQNISLCSRASTIFCAFNQCNIGGWRVNILIFGDSFNLSMYRIYFHLYMSSRCVAV